MKIDRLIGIVFILLQNAKVTAPFLAEKFEVSRRTINRDIEALCKAGIPIVTTQGNNGGIFIAEGYKIEKTLLTSKEMQAILAGIRSLDSISGNNYYRELVEKLCGKSEVSTPETIYDSSGHILIDLSSHYKGTLAPKIEKIRKAIEQRRLITFKYYYHKGETKRKIEPYLLVFQWSDWYVWGYCTNRLDFRLFKLNRLIHLEILEDISELRKLISFEKQKEEYFTNQIDLVARFDPCVKWRLIEEYGVDSFIELENGTLQFEHGFISKESLIRWILSFGNYAEILKPFDIRAEYIELLQKMQKKYK